MRHETTPFLTSPYLASPALYTPMTPPSSTPVPELILIDDTKKIEQAGRKKYRNLFEQTKDLWKHSSAKGFTARAQRLLAYAANLDPGPHVNPAQYVVMTVATAFSSQAIPTENDVYKKICKRNREITEVACQFILNMCAWVNPLNLPPKAVCEFYGRLKWLLDNYKGKAKRDYLTYKDNKPYQRSSLCQYDSKLQQIESPNNYLSYRAPSKPAILDEVKTKKSAVAPLAVEPTTQTVDSFTNLGNSFTDVNQMFLTPLPTELASFSQGLEEEDTFSGQLLLPLITIPLLPAPLSPVKETHLSASMSVKAKKLFPPASKFEDITQIYTEICKFQSSPAHQIAARLWQRGSTENLKSAVNLVLYAIRSHPYADETQFISAIMKVFLGTKGGSLSEESYYVVIGYDEVNILITCCLFVLDIVHTRKMDAGSLMLYHFLKRINLMSRDGYEYVRIQGKKRERTTDFDWGEDYTSPFEIWTGGHLKEFPLPPTASIEFKSPDELKKQAQKISMENHWRKMGQPKKPCPSEFKFEDITKTYTTICEFQSSPSHSIACELWQRPATEDLGLAVNLVLHAISSYPHAIKDQIISAILEVFSEKTLLGEQGYYDLIGYELTNILMTCSLLILDLFYLHKKPIPFLLHYFLKRADSMHQAGYEFVRTQGDQCERTTEFDWGDDYFPSFTVSTGGHLKEFPLLTAATSPVNQKKRLAPKELPSLDLPQKKTTQAQSIVASAPPAPKATLFSKPSSSTTSGVSTTTAVPSKPMRTV